MNFRVLQLQTQIIDWRALCQEEKKIIAGNWKMNKTPSEHNCTYRFELKPLAAINDVDVVFCESKFLQLISIPAIEAAKGSNIEIGAENMYLKRERCMYTGRNRSEHAWLRCRCYMLLSDIQG